MIEKHEGFIVHGSTGCSCCQDQNFACGIYLDDVVATTVEKSHQTSRTVCSQYSENGIYKIVKV